MAYRILIVDDEIALQNMVKEILIQAGYETAPALSCAQALEQFRAIQPDAVLLDVNLPDGDGFSLFGKLREGRDVPVLFLSARDEDADRLQGLGLGADDYITKPFSLAVLRARVNTQLRRTAAPQAERVQLDGFTFDFGRMEFSRNGVPVELSKTEQKLLRLLVEHRGQTLTRAALVDRIWTDGAEYVDENALSVTVKRLRDKLEDMPSKPRYIKTVYGLGYTWAVN